MSRDTNPASAGSLGAYGVKGLIMPDSPDFDQMARRMIDLVKVLSVEEIAAQLRLVWNARGAAVIDPVTNAVDEWVRAGAGTYDELQAVVEQAITALDR